MRLPALPSTFLYDVLAQIYHLLRFSPKPESAAMQTFLYHRPWLPSFLPSSLTHLVWTRQLSLDSRLTRLNLFFKAKTRAQKRRGCGYVYIYTFMWLRSYLTAKSWFVTSSRNMPNAKLLRAVNILDLLGYWAGDLASTQCAPGHHPAWGSATPRGPPLSARLFGNESGITHCCRPDSRYNGQFILGLVAGTAGRASLNYSFHFLAEVAFSS